MNRLFLLTATGTDVGKTHLGEALLLGTNPHRAGCWKPYESGVSADQPSDSERILAAAAHSGWSTLPPLGRFPEPVAPPVAARAHGTPIELGHLADAIAAQRPRFDPLIVELAGGLLAPLAEGATAIELANALGHAELIVVARNRLGVLHDVLATVTAARHHGLRIAAIALNGPAVEDPSAASNEAMLREHLALRWPAPPPLFALPYAAPSALAASDALHALARALDLPPRAVPQPAASSPVRLTPREDVAT